MKLTIFGKHPIPQGGFNGVMSIFEAIEFSRLGYDVTLAIPFEDKNEHEELLARNKIRDLNELEKLGGYFDIKAVFPDGENFDECDILVYQSYFPKDHELFWDLCCTKSKLRTKNFPKFVTHPYAVQEDHIIGQFSQFHLVACALEEDYDLLRSNAAFSAQFKNSFAYVPRGASPELLHPGYKAGLPPTIGLDTPNNNDNAAVQHFIEPLNRLRSEIPELRVFTLGKEIEGISSQKIPFGRFDRIYENFFNQIHTYLTINYEHSPQHLQARVQKEMPSWSKKAIYEVQNIEAQMSGATIVGHRDNIISELYIPGETGFNFTAFDSPTEIYETLKHLIDKRLELAKQARAFAVERHNWSKCIRLWSNALQRRLTT